MWQRKTFKTRARFLAWVDKNDHRMQWVEIFINNGYGVEYRRLRVIG